MFYYRYNPKCVIIEKSTEPIDDEHTCQCEKDFDLDLNTVYVGSIKDNLLVYYTLKAKSQEVLAKRLKVTQEDVYATQESVSDTQDALCEQSAITEGCISDIENAMCESELLTDERITAIEDALCELSTLLEG